MAYDLNLTNRIREAVSELSEKILPGSSIEEKQRWAA